jgi:D-arginine utilization repressor
MSSLTPYFAIADGLAALFKPFVEAVVHDLRTDCVAYVAHPFSPREAGDPSDMEDVTFAEGVQVIGPYEKVNFDGRRIKSISILLRGEKNKPIGMLCINADVTEFEAVRRMLQGFLGVSETTTQVSTLFHEDWHEKVNRFVAAWTPSKDAARQPMSPKFSASAAPRFITNSRGSKSVSPHESHRPSGDLESAGSRCRTYGRGIGL